LIRDRVKRDIETAKKLGIKTCYARYGEKNPVKEGESSADFEIESIKEILKLIPE
jgi:FMN phosphatase YigB (HAD superfamily)